MAKYIDADLLIKTISQHDYILSDVCNTRDRGMFTVGILQAISMQPAITLNVNNWISVKDRLPERNVRVLCFSPQMKESGGISVQLGWMCKPCKSSDITHWMPLPEPPKGD